MGANTQHSEWYVQNGRIAELGSHHQLLARDGIYARMWDKQVSPSSQSLPVVHLRIYQQDSPIARIPY